MKSLFLQRMLNANMLIMAGGLSEFPTWLIIGLEIMELKLAFIMLFESDRVPERK